MSDLYTQLTKTIIQHQEGIIGPISWTQASKVKGISVKGKDIKITGDGKKVLESLVNQYATIFGQASIQACKDAIKSSIPQESQNDLPSILL